jgi:hypothetical protein
MTRYCHENYISSVIKVLNVMVVKLDGLYRVFGLRRFYRKPESEKKKMFMHEHFYLLVHNAAQPVESYVTEDGAVL